MLGHDIFYLGYVVRLEDPGTQLESEANQPSKWEASSPGDLRYVSREAENIRGCPGPGLGSQVSQGYFAEKLLSFAQSHRLNVVLGQC